jgi:hypothetical protein
MLHHFSCSFMTATKGGVIWQDFTDGTKAVSCSLQNTASGINGKILDRADPLSSAQQVLAEEWLEMPVSYQDYVTQN